MLSRGTSCRSVGNLFRAIARGQHIPARRFFRPIWRLRTAVSWCCRGACCDEKSRADFRSQVFETSARKIEGRREARRVLDSSHEARDKKLIRLVAPGRFLVEKRIVMSRRVRIGSRRSRSLALLEQHRPSGCIVAIGSGAQEKLGYLYAGKSVVSAGDPLHRCCTGIHHGRSDSIPDWADRSHLGWFFRLLAQPLVFIPRLSRA